MHRQRILTVLAALTVMPWMSFADTGGDPPPPPRNDPPPAAGVTKAQPGEVQSDAARLYGNAYQEVAKGQKDLEKGDAKKARKRFEKALGWCETAVGYEPEYHEAWNLIGFTARKLDDYEKSLTAYETCLELAPQYAPAREYLGEALVELGRFDDAREQVVWLERLKDPERAEKLAGMIKAAEAAKAQASETSSK